MKRLKHHIKNLDILRIVSITNKVKKKIEYLASLNPFMLFIGYIIFLIIPYIPNIPLYLIMINKSINRYVKYGCLVLSILFTILQNVLILHLIFK
jgi:hypothetical protein